MRYYIIAGEASGDLHASGLMKEIFRLDPHAEFRIWGGDLMKEQGGTLVRHYKDAAFMGFLEVLLNFRTITRNLSFCKRDVKEYQPDVIILVDYPGFNLRIARYANQAGIRVFYYISPQVWAWKSSRVKTIKKLVERMFVILPFEKEFYSGFDYAVDYVGHPLLDVINEGNQIPGKEDFIRRNSMDNRPVIALLPGSRRQEISAILPVMLKAAASFPDHQPVVAAIHTIPDDFYYSISGSVSLSLVREQTYELLKHSVAAMVTSGTATLEAALIGTPQVVCYRGNPISYMIARKIVHVKYISLVNLIMDKLVVNELIQRELTCNNLASGLRDIMPGGSRRDEVIREYSLLWDKLGGTGASARTAALIIQYLREKKVT